MTLGNVCRAPEVGFEPAINPVTGKPCFVGQTEDDDMFYTDGPHPLCILINPTGACPFFKAEQPVWFERAIRN